MNRPGGSRRACSFLFTSPAQTELPRAFRPREFSLGMSVYQRSTSAAARSRLREFIKALGGAPPTPEDTRIRLEFVLKARSELAAGHGDMLRLLAPTAAADILGDPDRIAAYAESLAAEALISDAAGQHERAEAIRRHAVAIAREAARRSPVPDPEIDQLIARDGRVG